MYNGTLNRGVANRGSGLHIFQLIAAKVANPKKPTDVPKVFRDSAPWEMKKGRDAGCLCTICENLEQIRRGQMTAVTLLEKHIQDEEEKLHEEGISDDYKLTKQKNWPKDWEALSEMTQVKLN